MRKINTRSFVRATRSTPREINLQILLNLVREHQPISRADLARRMKIGRGMVTYLIGGAASREGAIYEGDTVDSPRGRRPHDALRPHARPARRRDRHPVQQHLHHADGLQRQRRSPWRRSTRSSTRRRSSPSCRRASRACSSRTRRVAEVQRDRPRRAGHGGPPTGRVLNAPQLGLARRRHPRDRSRRPLGLAGARRERADRLRARADVARHSAAATRPTDFVYVTVSDGVGAGVVVNGEVVRGHDNSAGEFGHVPIDPRTDRPVCAVRHGCLEAYTSNLATLSRYLGQEFSPTDGARAPARVRRHDRRSGRAARSPARRARVEALAGDGAPPGRAGWR